MSIRKPYYKISSATGQANSEWTNASGWYVSRQDTDGDLYKVSIDRGGYATREEEYAKPKFVPTPEWVEQIEDHNAECFDMGGYHCKVMAVCYKPAHTMGVGFSKVYILDNSTYQPFPQMKGVWKETKHRRENQKMDAMYRPMYPKCSIEEDGRLSGPFGIPDVPSLSDVIQDMLIVWDEWKEFPKVETYEMVERLREAKRDVAVMQREMEGNGINKEIEEYRAEIKESQEKIAKLEKELNDICERAADAMNLLEENGVKIDLDDKKDGEDDDGTVDGYAGDLSINHAYPGQGILIDPPPSGTLMSTLPPEAFQLSKEELEIFQKEFADPSSYLTVYNGTLPVATASKAS